MNTPFTPLPLFDTGVAQTLAGSLLQFQMPLRSISEYISLGDGDATTAEISTPPEWKVTDTTMVLIHGLAGSHTSPYLVRISKRLYKMGIRSVRLNLRNCGSALGLSKKIYHSGCSCDVIMALKQLKKKFPLSPHLLVGFSLGGNIALKCAGELGSEIEKYIHEIYAICPPLKLSSSMHLLSLSKHKIFEQYFLKSMQTQLDLLRKKRQDFIAPKYNHINRLKTFDDKVIAPLLGFSSGEDYYEISSSINYISKITIPSKVLFAKDDPVINFNDINAIQTPPNMDVITTSQGGHLGFLSMPYSEHGFRWMDSLVIDWVTSFEKKQQSIVVKKCS